MSIIDKLLGGKDKRDDLDKIPDSPVMQSGTDTLYTEDVVDYICNELERRRDERTALELQWTLNANFREGHQNCDIDMVSHRISDENPVAKTDKERRVYNRIAPLMETRHANLKSINYDMVVNPRTAELDDYAKAKISTKILDYCQSVTDFNSQKDKLIAWSELTGTAFTLSYWDAEAGDVIGYRDVMVTDENGVALPSMSTFFYICEYFDITPAQFFDDAVECPAEFKKTFENLKHLSTEQLSHINSIIEDIKR